MQYPLSGCLENNGGDPNLCVETVCTRAPVGICPEVTRLKSELSQAQDTIAKLQVLGVMGQ